MKKFITIFAIVIFAIVFVTYVADNIVAAKDIEKRNAAIENQVLEYTVNPCGIPVLCLYFTCTSTSAKGSKASVVFRTQQFRTPRRLNRNI